MTTIRVFVSGRPVPKARARVVAETDPLLMLAGKKTRAYTPQTTVQWEQDVALSVLAALRRHPKPLFPPKAAVRVDTAFYLPRSKSTPTELKYPSDGRPDLDNLTKAVLDAIRHRAYEDDCQIIDLHLKKRFATPEQEMGVMILIGPPED